MRFLDRRRVHEVGLSVIAWIVGIAVIVLGWYIAAKARGSIATIPLPRGVFRLLWDAREAFAEQGVRTGVLAAGGLVCGMTAAAILVTLIGLVPRLEPLCYPYIVMLKATPAVALAPLLVVVFHSGPTVKIVISAVISFFPMVVGGIDGLKRTPERLRLLANSYDSSGPRRFLYVTGGYGLSGFLSGLKTSAPLSVVGAIVGEFVDASAAGDGGIGVYIASHAIGMYMDHVFAGVVVTTILGLGFFALASVIAALTEGVLYLGK